MYRYFISTCHTETCEASGVPKKALCFDATSPSVVCGACSVEITDKIRTDEVVESD